MKRKKIVSKDEKFLFELLQKRFPSEEYACLPQVRNATGYSSVIRTADAIAMSLWPSRGLDLHGFEFKSLRYIRSTIKWDGNYWNRPRLLPKPILGRLPPSGNIPWFHFDLHPAQEPYDIPSIQGYGIE